MSFLPVSGNIVAEFSQLFIVANHKVFVLVPIWALAVGFGLHSLMVYKGHAGNSGVTPNLWPTNSLLTLAADKPTLVMFAHPQCPCTKASLAELESLLVKSRNRFEPTILFYQPIDNERAASLTAGRVTFKTWTNSALVNAARSIPGLHVSFDLDGQLAKKFGAETSGYTALYSSHGQRLFAGGITGSRGHLGDNAGFETVLNIINNTPAHYATSATPVFGCELFNQCAISKTAKPN